VKLRLLNFLAPVAIVAACLQPAGSSEITFDFTSDIGGSSSFSKTVSGYTLTFSNPSPTSLFEGDGDGLAIGNIQNPNLVNQFQIVLTGGPVTDALLFKNYEVGYVASGAGSGAEPFTLTGGTGTSTNNSLASASTFNFNGTFSISQGQTVLFSSPDTTSWMLSQIKFMTFTVVPVPEPSTYALSAIGVALLGYQARRRRFARG